MIRRPPRPGPTNPARRDPADPARILWTLLRTRQEQRAFACRVAASQFSDQPDIAARMLERARDSEAAAVTIQRLLRDGARHEAPPAAP